MRLRIALSTAVLLAASAALAPSAQRTWSPPTPFAVENVALGTADEAPRVTLVLRDGRIDAVLEAGAPTPSGLRPIDGSELIALPAFVDAFTTVGVETPKPAIDRDHPLDVESDVRIDMRLANRKGIQPSFDAVDVAELDDDRLEDYRKAGFGAALQAPQREILAGRSVLVTLREAALRDRVMRPRVFAHSAFRASGSGYPSTLMGHISQLRQFFLDVSWQQQLNERYDAGRSGPRPAHDAELEAGVELLEGGRRMLSEAQTIQSMRRVARCSGEMGFDYGIVGGREAYRGIDLFAAQERPLVLTLKWGDEPDDPRPDDVDEDEDSEDGEKEEGTEEEEADEQTDDDGASDRWVYEVPFEVRLDKRLRWEERRDGALRLAEAGVPFAIGTRAEDPADVLEKVRGLIERGLPEQTALAALTTVPARWMGVAGRLGEIAVGADATLCLWTANPLTDEDAEALWMFVDGHGWHNQEVADELD